MRWGRRWRRRGILARSNGLADAIHPVACGSAAFGRCTMTFNLFSVLLPVRPRDVPRHAFAGMTLAAVGTVGAIVSGLNVRHLAVPSLGYVDGAAWAAMTSRIMLGAPLGVRAAEGLKKNWLKHTYSLLLFGIAAAMALRMLG